MRQFTAAHHERARDDEQGHREVLNDYDAMRPCVQGCVHIGEVKQSSGNVKKADDGDGRDIHMLVPR